MPRGLNGDLKYTDTEHEKNASYGYQEPLTSTKAEFKPAGQKLAISQNFCRWVKALLCPSITNTTKESERGNFTRQRMTKNTIVLLNTTEAKTVFAQISVGTQGQGVEGKDILTNTSPATQ